MLDVAETRGFVLSVPKAKKVLKGLPRATHCTDRAQTSGNVTPTVELCPPRLTFETKVRARRDESEKQNKMTIIREQTVYTEETYCTPKRWTCLY